MALAAISFIIGLAVAALTAPVGVSGAVFMLPIQLTAMDVAITAVTPTNLLFNIVAIPGSLARYSRHAPLRSPLTTVLLTGTLPGVVLGAAIRVFFIPNSVIFLLVAVLLCPLGIALCLQATGNRRTADRTPPTDPFMILLSFVVGVIGGIYGIGGGSLISPVLVGRGVPVTVVAPAALTSTFVTSVVGAAAFVLIDFTTDQNVTPDWTVGLAAGLGGLCGGYLGALLQPVLPEKGMRIGLGVGAVITAFVFLFMFKNLP